jgi:anti-anti-sigma factor
MLETQSSANFTPGDATSGDGTSGAATSGDADSGDGRPETPLQRLDRNLDELTGELRVTVTGVQVLFAFLLVVPFNSGFVGIGPFERGVYFVTLLCSALAALCMMAPAAYHRMLFREYDKRHLVALANRWMIAGLAFLALAICGSLLLVTTKLFGTDAGLLTAAIAAVFFALLWFAAPLRRRAALERADRRLANGPRRFSPAGEGAGGWAKSVRYDSHVSAQEHLRVDVRREQDRVVLRLAGELDLASSTIFERALEEPEISASPLLVLDLDGLKFVDSSGLRIILLAHERSRERGQEFAITPGSPQVQRLLSITSVSEHLHVLASPDDLLV